MYHVPGLSPWNCWGNIQGNKPLAVQCITALTGERHWLALRVGQADRVAFPFGSWTNATGSGLPFGINSANNYSSVAVYLSFCCTAFAAWSMSWHFISRETDFIYAVGILYVHDSRNKFEFNLPVNCRFMHGCHVKWSRACMVVMATGHMHASWEPWQLHGYLHEWVPRQLATRKPGCHDNWSHLVAMTTEYMALSYCQSLTSKQQKSVGAAEEGFCYTLGIVPCQV